MAKLDSGGSDGGSDSDGTTQIIQVNPRLPGWLAALKPVAKVLLAFGRDPYGFVATIISVYVLQSVFGLASYVVGSILAAFNTITGAIGFAQSLLITAFSALGDVLLIPLVALEQALASVVAGAGAAAPIIAVAGSAVLLYGVYRLLRFIIALIDPR